MVVMIRGHLGDIISRRVIAFVITLDGSA